MAATEVANVKVITDATKNVQKMDVDVTVSTDKATDKTKKRKTRFSDEETKKRPKTGGLSDVDKNACMLLNEKCRDVVYSVTSQVGPVHMPMFTIEATVNGQTFVGSGPSKKRAKLAAAEAAVQALNLYAETESDLANNSCVASNSKATAATQSICPDANSTITVEPASSNDDSAPLLIGKHPVLMLNELRPRAEYVPFDDESGWRKCKVTVDGQTFEGEGSNKKLAKAKAAEAALTNLFDLTFSYLKDGQPVYQGDDSQWTQYKIREPAASVDTVDGKNPIQMLNELFSELHYEFVDTSSDVTPGAKFSVVLEINGRTYRGEGATKKMAKNNCALAAVKELMASGVIKSRMAEKAKKKRMNRHTQGTVNSSFLDSAVIKLAVHFPDLQYRLVSQNDLWSNGQMTYSVAVTVRGENFVASGPTEKVAKNQVASKVLTKFGLWSADDKRMKEEAARVEADSTNPTFVRGARGGGKRFIRGSAGRGIGRGVNFSNPSTDGTSSYNVSTLMGQQVSEQICSSSEWHASSVSGVATSVTGLLEGGISFGRGAGLTSTFSQTSGLITGKDDASNRGRVSYVGGSPFRGVASRGHLGRSNQVQSGVGVGLKRGGLGRGGISFVRSEQASGSVGYLGESGDTYRQNDTSFSQEFSGSTYHGNTTNTFGNKDAAMSTRGKSKTGYFSGNSVKGIHGLAAQKHSNQKNVVLDSARRWSSEKNPGWVDQTRSTKWMGKTETWNTGDSKAMKVSESSWCYETTGVNDASSSVYLLSNEVPFIGGYEASPHLPASEVEYFDGTNAQTSYFQQDNYFAGNSYEYESVGAYGGAYEVDSGFSYEQYGAYGNRLE